MHTPPPTVPAMHYPAPAPSNIAIVDVRPGDVICGGTRVQPVDLQRPFPSTYGVWPGSPPLTPNRLRFRIDAQGRAVSIVRAQGPQGSLPNSDDLSASLAVSRFAPGQPRAGCEISYDVRLTPIAQAGLPMLADLVNAPDAGNTQEAWDLLNAAGDCRRGPSGPRIINYPSFERIAQPAGTRGWTFLRFDVDARGRTRNIQVAYSSGNAALDRASDDALRKDRYEPNHAVTGCTYRFYHEADHPLPSPVIPPDAPEGPQGAACDLDPESIRGLYSGDAYPAAFRTRRVEGYAIVGFDTASWGAVGNVTVLASEPAEQFGQVALQAILNARVAPSDHGQRGCVQRVRFRLPSGQ